MYLKVLWEKFSCPRAAVAEGRLFPLHLPGTSLANGRARATSTVPLMVNWSEPNLCNNKKKITHRFLLFGWLSRFKDLQWGCRFRFFFDVEKREKRTKYFTSVCLTFSAALLASIWFLSKPGSKNRPVLCVWGVPRHSCTIRFASLLIVDGFYLEHHLKYHPAVNLCVYVFVYFVMKLRRVTAAW